MTQNMREALIRPQAISRNVEILRSMANTPQMMIVVKADGYGHGALTAARAAVEGGATWLGTADIQEALDLRSQGVDVPVLAWLYGPGEDISPALEHSIDLAVSSTAQLEQVVAASSTTRPAAIHLKIDTGLGRNGVDNRDWDQFFRQVSLQQKANRIRVVGIFTHLSGTNEEADADQGGLFDQACAVARSLGIEPELRHVASSIGTSDSPGLAYDMVRVGAAAYGVPVTQRYHSVGLTPAMRVSAQVVLTKRVAANWGIGYGHTYRTSGETNLALIPLGYADGIPRHASSRGPVTLGGHRFSVAGRISMDQFTVDVGGYQPEAGEWCVLWGDPAEGDPSANDWAEAADTIAYEIVTRLGPRVPRVVHK
jgi:alanine racemase